MTIRYPSRCAVCAAGILNDEDMQAHMRLHQRPCLCCDHPSKNDDKPFVQELGNWDTV